MKITILYDNETKKEELKKDWGFSCIIEREGGPSLPLIMFDTGADGAILLHNMKELGIETKDIGIVVISHDHWDHTRGLSAILKENERTKVYLPGSFPETDFEKRAIRVKDIFQIGEDIFSTGELNGIEQSLIIKTDKGIVAVVGCSHSGVENILKVASQFGKLYGIVGGFHGFRNYEALNDLSLICPCHCTQYKKDIRSLFPDRSLECGAGVVIDL